MKFVFDLDGTICFKGQPVSEEILTALERLTDKGHEVIFASARPIRDMLPVIHKRLHHYPMIGGNGSLITKNKKNMHSTAFSTQEIREIKHLIKKYNATYLIDSEWDYAYTGVHDHPILKNVDQGKLARLVDIDDLSTIVKILILSASDMDQLEEELTKLDVFVNKHGNENVLDISPKGIHKWKALQMLGIQKGDYIAFGNDANDLTMFEHAYHTVMIGYHGELSQYAKEKIDLEGDYEQKIVEKLKKLASE